MLLNKHSIFVILSAILLSVISPVASAVFWTAIFEAVLNAFVGNCLVWSRRSCQYLLLK